MSSLDRRGFLSTLLASLPLVLLPPWWTWLPMVGHGSNRKFGWGICIPPQLAYERPWLVPAELELLRPSVYMNYGTAPLARRDGCKFYPMVYNRQMQQSLNVIDGTDTWLFLNEPERPDQANHSPSEGIALYREFRTKIELLAPESTIAAPGVAVRMSDHNGMDWLTQFMGGLDKSEWPTLFHVHLYRSYDLPTFDRSWRTWKTWQQVHAPDIPVMLSETCAENAPVTIQKQVMYRARELLEREILGVFWFHTHAQSAPSTWPNAALCNVTDQTQSVTLTELGTYWMTLQV